MRRVTQSEFVRRSVEKATKTYPSFQMAWDHGVLWHLQRSSLEDAVELPGLATPTYMLETNAWRQAGLPIMRIAYVLTPDGLEVIKLALL